VILGNGRVGIGTVIPNAMLHVAGAGIVTENLSVGTFSQNARLTVECNNGAGLYVKTLHPNDYGYGIISYVGNPTTKAYVVNNNGTENVIIYGDGRICARKVHVKLDEYFDIVFAPDYKLMSLYDLKAFIEKNSHLPDVPPEKEALENGISIGEFNAILLKKIEELTLYTIKQQEEIDDLKKQISNNK